MYSLSVSGSVVQMHFCGQEIESISFLESSKSCCCAAAKDTSADRQIGKQEKDCCDNVAISFKINADQHVEAAKQLQLLQIATVAPSLLHYTVYQAPSVSGVQLESYDANAPPPGLWQDIPLYKLFQRIVYYG